MITDFQREASLSHNQADKRGSGGGRNGLGKPKSGCGSVNGGFRFIPLLLADGKLPDTLRRFAQWPTWLGCKRKGLKALPSQADPTLAEDTALAGKFFVVKEQCSPLPPRALGGNRPPQRGSASRARTNSGRYFTGTAPGASTASW